MKFKAPSDTNTGDFLRAPGTYHLIIIVVAENPTTTKGQLIDGFQVSSQVVEGTVQVNDKCTEIGKTIDVTLWHPDLTRDDQGERSRKIQMKFFEAVGLLVEGDRGQEVELNLEDAVGRQWVAKFDMDKDEKYLRLHYGDLWHVDDPAVKDIPKCKASLGLIPASQRMIGGKPAVAGSDGTGKGKSGGKKESAVSRTSTVVAPTVDDI